MESTKRVISLMALRTRAKHNIHSRFRRDVDVPTMLPHPVPGT